MRQEDLEEFTKLLMQWVRDPSVRSCDSSLRPESRVPVSARWRAAAQGGSTPPEVVIPDCVDETLFHLLTAIDQEVIDISFKTEDGRVVRLADSGELAGWFMGTDGWRHRYSSERFVDDFADLAGDD